LGSGSWPFIELPCFGGEGRSSLGSIRDDFLAVVAFGLGASDGTFIVQPKGGGNVGGFWVGGVVTWAEETCRGDRAGRTGGLAVTGDARAGRSPPLVAAAAGSRAEVVVVPPPGCVAAPLEEVLLLVVVEEVWLLVESPR